MRKLLPGLLVGLLFGAGLALSDMVNPSRVLNFLDVAGRWDPTLAFVLGAALVPSVASYALMRKMQGPLLETEFFIPKSREVELRLLTGAALFGIGWGLVGLCPGPAIAGLAFGNWQNWLFVAAQVGGMALHRAFANLNMEWIGGVA